MAERHRFHRPHHRNNGGDNVEDDNGNDENYVDNVDHTGAAGAAGAAGAGARNPYASSNRWRHQESSAYARHASNLANQPRDAEVPNNDTKDLTAFLNASRVPPSKGSAGAAGAVSGAAGAVSGAAGSGGSANDNGNASPGNSSTAARFTPIVVPASVDAAASMSSPTADGRTDAQMEGFVDGKEIIAGPLLNYRRMEGNQWIGSVLIVTRGGGKTQPVAPTLELGPADGGSDGGKSTQKSDGATNAADAAPATKAPTAPHAADGALTNGASATVTANGSSTAFKTVHGICLYSDPRNTFWRFDLSVPMGPVESRWQYSIPDVRYASSTKPRTNIFVVPAVTESMRILFFSCNGFSVGTDEDAWCGPALWNDVARCHAKTPFHVMIGGGDQIYNDSIRVAGPLREWTAIANPKKRREYPFPESLRKDCDDFYLHNYIRWYSTEPFASANGQIAQLNIWDDHDIIDGFGSYVNEFMKCDVFRGIGGVAHKYYMLFQHHLPPPPSTYTSDMPELEQNEGRAVDPTQLVDTYVAPPIYEPNYIIGSKPGPYIAERSYNMYAKLGARMAFLGLDARTEVNYPETYDQIFDRAEKEFKAASSSGQPIRHLILLLGIPIAYPRLTWLENVFNSPLMGPVKLMNRRLGFGGGFFNHFDGSVDLLDDLDDHYTARTHKKERNRFVERLQTLSAEHSVRITILGGDVHLAALGRFYSNPKLGVPSENDFRFMVNVVSSAITNKPPPAAIANLLARRNKIHHLNSATDETLFKLFDKDPGNSSKTAGHNRVTMPSRNFALITENSPNNHGVASRDRPQTAAPAGAAEAAGERRPVSSRSSSRFRRRSASRRRENGTSTANNGAVGNGNGSGSGNAPVPPGSSAGLSVSGASTKSRPSEPTGRSGHYALNAGEEGAGTQHKAAGELHGQGNDGSLDVCIRVEINQHDPEGRTEPYGLTIPALDYTGPPPVPSIPHHFRSSRPTTARQSVTTASS
ncbi:hypothetical protein SPI_05316 [Niveomyces insectorum RCEF 264]|uniref:PhoD-like phosphatase domain-containing protein n=1 Tax=Niveomyces insectorum RCEF 264 TaxID=1081102 RepID=A0A167U6K7_9HYPO|nr:hypothetical protein SPI_05316 [Niveomyces insectorum RCEF 264]